jgi:hypothetical protein
MKKTGTYNDIVYLTRSKLVVMVLGACSHLKVIWTEYSTVNPTDSTKAMFENPVMLTPARTLKPIMEKRHVRTVSVIIRDPMRVPKKTLDLLCCC